VSISASSACSAAGWETEHDAADTLSLLLPQPAAKAASSITEGHAGIRQLLSAFVNCALLACREPVLLAGFRRCGSEPATQYQLRLTVRHRTFPRTPMPYATWCNSGHSGGTNEQPSDGKDVMKLNRGIAAAILLSFAMAGLSACEKKGPMEKAGQAVDDAAKKTGEAVKDAGDKIKDAAK
jgi:hypothetical protein